MQLASEFLLSISHLQYIWSLRAGKSNRRKYLATLPFHAPFAVSVGGRCVFERQLRRRAHEPECKAGEMRWCQMAEMVGLVLGSLPAESRCGETRRPLLAWSGDLNLASYMCACALVESQRKDRARFCTATRAPLGVSTTGLLGACVCIRSGFSHVSRHTGEGGAERVVDSLIDSFIDFDLSHHVLYLPRFQFVWPYKSALYRQ